MVTIAWYGLSAEQQAVLEAAARLVETDYSVDMVEKDQAAGRSMLEGGMQVITLPPADAEALVETALESYWSLLEAEKPDSMAKLRPLLSK
jgi:TRAP-type C4-dicarboxylate transport system substrate-binding protein